MTQPTAKIDRTISQPHATTPSLMAMTIRVGSGSWAPRPAKRVANVGMTFQRMAPTTTAAMTMTATG